MSRRLWMMWLGPPVALVAVALLLGRFQADAEAGGKPGVRPAGACAEAPLGRDALGRPDRGAGRGTWWTLSERLDGDGALVGRRLAMGRDASANLTLDLPLEAMASGPFAGTVALTSDDGRASQVRVVSERRGCAFLVRELPQLARGAVAHPDDGSLIVHLLDRASRADLGTWRFAADGTGEPVLVAPPLEPDPARGPNWVTDLRLDPTGTLLAVQSCTDEACVTRVFELGRGLGTVARIDGDQGPLIGIADGRVVTWARCYGLPCGILSWSLDGGAATVLLQLAESAALTANGRALVAVTDSTRHGYVRVRLADGDLAGLRGINGNERLVQGGVVGTSGLEVRADEVGLAAVGTIPRPFDPAAAEVNP